MNDLERIFPGDSEMARRMRAFDWTPTPLGSPDRWPNTLRTCVRITLTSRHPMFIWWGEQLINLYNDACTQFLQGRHPWALGRPAAEVWPEVWPQIGPRAQLALRQESGPYDESFPVVLHRKGYPEEAYVTFSYSPIPDDSGAAGGILCPVREETQQVIGKRRLALLKELAVRTAEANTPQEACELAASALATNPNDLPFALIYLSHTQSRELTLAGCFGLTPGSEVAPQRLDPEASSVWPITAVLEARHSRMIVDVSHLANLLPKAHGTFQLEHAAFLPVLTGARKFRAAGLLITGLNPLRLYDDDYEQFLELASRAIGTAVTHAEADEAERGRSEMPVELDRAKTEWVAPGDL